MNKALRVAVALIVVGLAGYAVIRWIADETRPPSKSAGPEDIQLQQLAAKHSAVCDWDKELRWRSYTAQVQKAVLRADSRPVAVSGRLTDIAVVNGRYRLQMSGSWSSRCDFLLECDEGIVASLLANPDLDRISGRCVAIIAAGSAEHPIFVLTASGDDATVATNGDSKVIVRGRCLAIEPIARSAK